MNDKIVHVDFTKKVRMGTDGGESANRESVSETTEVSEESHYKPFVSFELGAVSIAQWLERIESMQGYKISGGLSVGLHHLESKGFYTSKSENITLGRAKISDLGLENDPVSLSELNEKLTALGLTMCGPFDVLGLREMYSGDDEIKVPTNTLFNAGDLGIDLKYRSNPPAKEEHFAYVYATSELKDRRIGVTTLNREATPPGLQLPAFMMPRKARG